MNKTNNMRRKDIRRQLLTTVSALALLGSPFAAEAASNDADRPVVWIELGGQAERIDGVPERFSAPFFSNAGAAELAPMLEAQRPPPYTLGEDGKITFAPEGSDWQFSAAIRYGHSGAARHKHYQTNAPGFHFTDFGKYQYYPHSRHAMGDGQSKFRESHTIVDFQIGKDVGLGLFGSRGSSLVSAGVRFAQFTDDSHGTFRALRLGMGPPMTSPGKYTNAHDKYHASYTALTQRASNTRAVGPSISWDASVPIAGNAWDSTINLDWGVNVAALFGRQRAKSHQQTTGYSYRRTGGIFTGGVHTNHYAYAPADQNRSRNVMIPNLGGFAGLSFHYGDAKISFGYRGDFFFGAMDTGIDARKSTSRGFYGPFANISVGLGD